MHFADVNASSCLGEQLMTGQPLLNAIYGGLSSGLLHMREFKTPTVLIIAWSFFLPRNGPYSF